MSHPMDDWMPHRGRARLLERVERHDDAGLRATWRVAADGLYGDAGGVPAWIGIEAIAQAAAAWAAGARAGRAGRDGTSPDTGRGGASPDTGRDGTSAGTGPDGAPAAAGWLVAVRRYDAAVPSFPDGALLRVDVRREMAGDNGLSIFAGRILDDRRELAAGRVSVFTPGRADAP